MSNSNYESYCNGLREFSLSELREEYKTVRKVFIENHGPYAYEQFMVQRTNHLETEDLLHKGRHILSMLLIENNRYKYIYAYNRWGAFRCWDLGEFEERPDVNDIEGWDESLSWKVKASLVCKQITFEESASESYSDYLYEKDY